MAKRTPKKKKMKSISEWGQDYIEQYDKLEVQRSDNFPAYMKVFGPFMDDLLAKRGIKPPKP